MGEKNRLETTLREEETRVRKEEAIVSEGVVKGLYVWQNWIDHGFNLWISVLNGFW